VVEGARLESVYTPKVYHGFESHSLRTRWTNIVLVIRPLQGILIVNKVVMLLNKSWFSKFMTVFGYLMAVIYIGLGVMLLWNNSFPNVPKNFKFAFALFFIAYGFYRLVKMRSKVNDTND
jgi:hypothetical protein